MQTSRYRTCSASGSTILLHNLPPLLFYFLRIVMEKNTSSMVSNGGNNVSTEGSSSCSDIYEAHGIIQPHKKFKGIVPQQNGNWGAQIYADNHRVWLGTFKTEKEAAMAYDSAAIQFRSGDSHRNFPWTSITVEEPKFQSQFSQEHVLEMIKDGSYQPKFSEFLRAHHGVSKSNYGGLNLKRGWLSRKLLFQKKLTPSDVGKLNRIVIPKKDATTYFPEISVRVEQDAKSGVIAEAQVDFFDRMMRCWKFRYCYWKSSQSFVFTRGWSRFVKDKQLKADDVVGFYLCEFKEAGKMVKTFFMINPFRDEDSSIGGSSSVIEEGEKKIEMMEIEPPCNIVERKGFRLFGVQIN